MEAARARVLLVEDHPIFREGLAQLIDRQTDLHVCAEAASAREAITAVETHQPDLVLLDLTLEGTGGLELLKQLKAILPALPVLVLSMHEESVYAERALRGGAAGYLMKQEASGTVISAIRTVLRGEIYVSRKVEITLMLKGLQTPEAPGEGEAGSLSDRELQVFELIGAGIRTREIATRLGVSVKTIESHRENIKRKLVVADGTELAARAEAWVRKAT